MRRLPKKKKRSAEVRSSGVSVAPGSSTVYIVSGRNEQGCSNTASVSITIKACTGIFENHIAGPVITVCPNPTRSGPLTVVSEVPSSVRIFDSCGKLVLETEISAGTTSISLEQYPAGLYYFKTLYGAIKVLKTE
jgi:hypothetical protein